MERGIAQRQNASGRKREVAFASKQHRCTERGPQTNEYRRPARTDVARATTQTTEKTVRAGRNTSRSPVAVLFLGHHNHNHATATDAAVLYHTAMRPTLQPSVVGRGPQRYGTSAIL